MKTVWIVNQYSSTLDTGGGGRHFYLGRELAAQGYKVYIISSASHHLLLHKPKLEEPFKIETICDGFYFVWVKMPDYAQAHSKQRALNWFLFPWRIRKLAGVIPSKPDAILSSSPSLMAFLGAQRLARKFKARLLFEVRDIWPLTLIRIGGYSASHPFIRLMQWTEDKAYRESDAVVSNLKNAVEHMVTRGLAREKFTWVPNGFSLDETKQATPLNPLTAMQLPTNQFIVGYTGTLGVANALDVLIEAAEKLKDCPHIAFVLVGQGKEKTNLQSQVKEKHLDNVVFVDPIPKAEVHDILKRFDACYIGALNDDLYQFGIGANKIPDYLFSAKPIIHSYSGACDPIEEARAGITVPAEDSEKLSEAILKLYSMTPEQRASMGLNGRKVALEQYEYKKLAEKLAGVLFKP
ncbi:MAG: glycosyltransferase WbuB [Gammaproteobacteria bacterium HGW-Gammaproteobacteria-11]|nr:MAG: glycosyltransferase WbuB [Gammaproteobacteria bacterium HGW-Gammaproteobacteria-11]